MKDAKIEGKLSYHANTIKQSLLGHWGDFGQNFVSSVTNSFSFKFSAKYCLKEMLF